MPEPTTPDHDELARFLKVIAELDRHVEKRQELFKDHIENQSIPKMAEAVRERLLDDYRLKQELDKRLTRHLKHTIALATTGASIAVAILSFIGFRSISAAVDEKAKGVEAVARQTAQETARQAVANERESLDAGMRRSEELRDRVVASMNASLQSVVERIEDTRYKAYLAFQEDLQRQASKLQSDAALHAESLKQLVSQGATDSNQRFEQMRKAHTDAIGEIQVARRAALEEIRYAQSQSLSGPSKPALAMPNVSSSDEPAPISETIRDTDSRESAIQMAIINRLGERDFVRLLDLAPAVTDSNSLGTTLRALAPILLNPEQFTVEQRTRTALLLLENEANSQLKAMVITEVLSMAALANDRQVLQVCEKIMKEDTVVRITLASLDKFYLAAMREPGSLTAREFTDACGNATPRGLANLIRVARTLPLDVPLPAEEGQRQLIEKLEDQKSKDPYARYVGTSLDYAESFQVADALRGSPASLHERVRAISTTIRETVLSDPNMPDPWNVAGILAELEAPQP